MKKWVQFITSLEEELGKDTVDFWLRSLKVVNFDAQNLYLEAKDAFQVSWYKEHVEKKAKKQLLSNTHKPIKVHFKNAEPSAKDKPKKKDKETENIQEFEFRVDLLDEHYSNKNWISHEGAVFATKVYDQLVLSHKEKSNPPFNPIYLHGPKGSGKTHFLTALCKELQEMGVHALYVNSETFTQHVVQAFRLGLMHPFRELYRSSQALLIDDIDHFNSRISTQEEFFHTFNALHLENKLLVISSCMGPNELKGIEPRLVSRFEWGLVTPLSPPDPAAISTLFDLKAKQLEIECSPKIKSLLIEKFGSDITKLSEALNALILRLQLDPKEPVLSDKLKSSEVEVLLKDLIQSHETSQISPEKLIQTVSDYYGITLEDVLGKGQKREFSFPRKVAMFLCRKSLNLPYMKIGALFNKDHSTVMSSCKFIEKELKEAKNRLNQEIPALEAKIFVKN